VFACRCSWTLAHSPACSSTRPFYSGWPGIDIARVGYLLEDPRKTSVFHAASEDLKVLWHSYGIVVAGLFDTSLAEVALRGGVQQPSLADVLRARFDINLDKSLARSNWRQRPLTPAQVQYARIDTRFLVEMMQRQRAELEVLGRMGVVDSQNRKMEAWRSGRNPVRCALFAYSRSLNSTSQMRSE
jgi:ribonuclease D